MYKIFGRECDFNVNKDKKIVTAYIENVSWLFYSVYAKYLDPHDNPYAYYVSRNKASNRFSAKATCSENDEWNEEIGKQIAYMRLYKKVAEAFSRISTMYRNDVNRMLSEGSKEFNNHINKTTASLIKNDKNRLEKLGFNRNEL